MPSLTPDSKIFRRKLIVGLCAILFGFLGVHKFLLGYAKEGSIMLAISVFSWFTLMPLVWIAAIVEGVIYLRTPDVEFDAKYLSGYTPFF